MPEMIEKYWAGQCLALDIADLEFEKAFTAYEYTRDINAKRAELKVMVEGGTEDDLLALYSEAAAETNEQKKGIFATFIEKIVNVLRSIGQKITAFFSKKIPADKKKETVEVTDISDFQQSTGKLKGLIKNFTSAIKNNSLTDKVVDAMESEVARLIGTAAVGFVVGKIGNHAVTKSKDKKKKQTIEEIQAQAQAIANGGAELSELLDSVKDVDAGENSSLVKRGLSAISAAARAMGDASKGLMSSVANVITKGKTAANESEKRAMENAEKTFGSNQGSNEGESQNQGDNSEETKKESADDTIDVSTDEGMLAFEKMLDALVADDDDIAAPVTESTEDVPPETDPAAAAEEPQEADPEEVPAEEGVSDESVPDCQASVIFKRRRVSKLSPSARVFSVWNFSSSARDPST